MRRTLRLAIVLGVVLATTAVEAGTRQFSAGSLIIPMDICYQPTSGIGGWQTSCRRRSCTTSLPSGFPSNYCPDPVATPSDSVLKAYGLIYTLLQNSINVNYIIDPAKTTVDGVDLTVTRLGGNPVEELDHSSGSLSTFMTAGNTQVKFRGAPFIIDVTDAAAALAVIKADAASTTPMFGSVHVYQAMTNFNAPVKGTLIGPPPKIALNGLDPTNVQILEAYLSDAGISSTTTTCGRRGCTTSPTVTYWPNVGQAITVVGYDGKYTDFTSDDALKSGGFKVVWSPHWEGVSSILYGNNNTITSSSGAQSALDQVLAKMEAFADAGNSTFAECIGMGTLEGVDDSSGWAPQQAGLSHGHYLLDASGTQRGLSSNYLHGVSGAWPQGNAGESFSTPASDATHPIVQIGDYVFNSVDGYTEDFIPSSAHNYVSGVHRLLTTVAPSGESRYNNRDILVVGNKGGDSQKGLVVYLAGHRYDSSNQIAGERIPLNTLLFLGQINTTVELTRSAPIVFSDGKAYLGSYLQQSMPASAYPPWNGHFREYPAGALSGSNVTAFSAVTADWDAATHVQAQASADTRKIFTAKCVSGTCTQYDFTTGNAITLGLDNTRVTGVRKGGLGGIDHSIPAIIEPSTIAGSPSRPTVAYVGGLDGMLHAILVSGNVSGYTAGDELWAFIPPSQLGATANQQGGVDGSPSVGDAFVDTGSGTKTWRTLLAIPEGNFSGGTLDVLDVTDPTNPKFLWEASDSVTVGGKSYVLGRAQGAAISPVMTSTGLSFAFFVATDNTNGTAGNGFNLYALEAGKGKVLWRYNHTYTKDTTHNDVPGTVAVIDASGSSGPATRLYFGDVEGKVWSVDAASGSNASAIYDAAVANADASSVSYPIESGIVLYRDPSNSHLDVLGVTGGADWVPSATVSHVFKVDTGNNNAAVNLLNLAAGERVYAVPTIYGNAAYLITSTGNLQGSIGTDFSNVGGNLIRLNLGSAGGATTLATIKGGAAEVAVDQNGNVVAASTSGLTQNSNSGQDKSQSVIALQNAAAQLLTVRAWLDLH